MYKRPQILFLDEATSHLDIEREQQVNHTIGSMRVTRVIVAHRPETINSADRVIMLVDGKVVKPGLASPASGVRHEPRPEYLYLLHAVAGGNGYRPLARRADLVRSPAHHA